MNKLALFLCMSLLGILLMPNVMAEDQVIPPGGCCIIKDCCIAGDNGCTQETQCTFWDMSGWSMGEDFCNKLQLWGYATETIWYDYPCEYVEMPADCDDGSDIPEFNTITAGLALAGAGLGFIFLRKKK